MKRRALIQKYALTFFTAAAMTVTSVSPAIAIFAEENSAPTAQTPAETPAPSDPAETPAPTAPETPEVPEQPAEPAEPESPATPETPAVPAEPETPAETDTGEQPAQTEQPAAAETPADTSASEDAIDPQADEEAALASSFLALGSVSTTLSNMLSSSMGQVQVSYADQNIASSDQTVTGTVVLDIDMSSLLKPASKTFNSSIGFWPNAKLWPVVEQDKNYLGMNLNIALPAGTVISGTPTVENTTPDLSWGDYSGQLVNSAAVTPNGSSAAVDIRLGYVQYGSMFSAVDAGTAGHVKITLPVTSTVTKGENVTTPTVSASGTVGSPCHVTGKGIPLSFNIALDGTTAPLFTDKVPYAPVAGTVDETLQTPSTLIIADGKQDPYQTIAGDDFSMTGTVDVSAIQEKLDQVVKDYNVSGDLMQSVMLADTTFTMDAAFNMPKGVDWNGDLSSVTFNGPSGFAVQNVVKNGSSVDVTFGFAATPANLKELYDMSNAAGNQISVVLDGFTATNAAPVGQILTATGTVSGDLNTKAIFTQGDAQYDIHFKFEDPNPAQARLGIAHSSDVNKSVTLNGTLAAGTAAAGADYKVAPDTDFPLTGTLDITGIKDEIKRLNDEYVTADIPADSIDVTMNGMTFTASFDVPEGITWTKGELPVLKGADGKAVSDFTVLSAEQDGNKVNVKFALANPSNYNSFESVVNMVESTPDQLSIALDGFKMNAGTPAGTTVQLSANVIGSMDAVAVYQKLVNMNIHYDFNAGPLTASVTALNEFAGEVDKDLALTTGLQIDHQDKLYVAKVNEPFDVTGTVDVSPIADEINRVIDGYQVGDALKEVALDGTAFEMVSTFTLPEGVEWNGTKADAVFAGADGFVIKDVVKDGQTVAVSYGLANTPTNLDDLVKILNSVAADKTLSLTLSNVQATDAAKKGEALAVTGEVKGDLNTTATLPNKAKYKIHYGFTPKQEAKAELGVMADLTVDKNIDLTGTLAAGTAAAGETYQTPVTKDFALTGTLDVTPIKDEVKRVYDEYVNSNIGAADIPVATKDMTFTATFDAGTSIDWTKAGDPELTGTDGSAVTGFEVKGVEEKDGKVVVTFGLADPASIDSFEKMNTLVNGVPDQMQVKVDGFSVKADTAEGTTLPVSASVTGSLDASASYGDLTKADIKYTFDAEDLKASVNVVSPYAGIVDETIDMPNDLLINNSKDLYKATVGEPFSMTGTLDVSAIADKMDEVIDKYEVADLLDQVKLDGTDFAMKADFVLPDGVDWTGSTADAAFSGASGFNITNVTKNGNTVTVDFALDKTPATLQDLADILHSIGNDKELKLELNGFSATDQAAKGVVLQAQGDVKGSLDTVAELPGSELFKIHFGFENPGTATADLMVKDEQTVQKTVALPGTLSAGDKKPGETHETETGTTFPLKQIIDLAPVSAELDDLQKKFGDTPADKVSVSLDNFEFTSFFDLPQGMNWDGKTLPTLSGADDFEVKSAKLVDGKLQVVLALKDPAAVKTLAQLEQIVSNSKPVLKADGFSLAKDVKPGTELKVTTELSGQMNLKAESENGKSVTANYGFTGEESTGTIVKAKAESGKPATPSKPENPAKPGTEKPSKPGTEKPAENTNKKPANTGVESAEGWFAAALGASALGAALLSVFKRKKK